MNGYSDCIIGVVERAGADPVICYDRDKVLDKLVAEGMSDEEALEFYTFNQLGAYVGAGTPCFLITDWEVYDDE